MHELPELYWEYSPGIAAVPSPIHSEFQLTENSLKLVIVLLKASFSYENSDLNLQWGKVQKRGASGFQDEPVLDKPCFYA